MEHSVALLRMYLYCDLWTLSHVVSTSISVELKIEICGNPSDVASWFISLSFLSEEFCLQSFYCIPDSLGFLFWNFSLEIQEFTVFSWVFSVYSRIHVCFCIKHLASSIYNVHPRHFCCAWVSIMLDCSGTGKIKNACDSRHDLPSLFRDSRWVEECTLPTRNRFATNKNVCGSCNLTSVTPLFWVLSV